MASANTPSPLATGLDELANPLEEAVSFVHDLLQPAQLSFDDSATQGAQASAPDISTTTVTPGASQRAFNPSELGGKINRGLPLTPINQGQHFGPHRSEIRPQNPQYSHPQQSMSEGGPGPYSQQYSHPQQSMSGGGPGPYSQHYSHPQQGMGGGQRSPSGQQYQPSPINSGSQYYRPLNMMERVVQMGEVRQQQVQINAILEGQRLSQLQSDEILSKFSSMMQSSGAQQVESVEHMESVFKDTTAEIERKLAVFEEEIRGGMAAVSATPGLVPEPAAVSSKEAKVKTGVVSAAKRRVSYLHVTAKGAPKPPASMVDGQNVTAEFSGDFSEDVMEFLTNIRYQLKHYPKRFWCQMTLDRLGKVASAAARDYERSLYPGRDGRMFYDEETETEIPVLAGWCEFEELSEWLVKEYYHVSHEVTKVTDLIYGPKQVKMSFRSYHGAWMAKAATCATPFSDSMKQIIWLQAMHPTTHTELMKQTQVKCLNFDQFSLNDFVQLAFKIESSEKEFAKVMEEPGSGVKSPRKSIESRCAPDSDDEFEESIDNEREIAAFEISSISAA